MIDTLRFWSGPYCIQYFINACSQVPQYCQADQSVEELSVGGSRLKQLAKDNTTHVG
jgi:hypothetical protein